MQHVADRVTHTGPGNARRDVAGASAAGRIVEFGFVRAGGIHDEVPAAAPFTGHAGGRYTAHLPVELAIRQRVGRVA